MQIIKNLQFKRAQIFIVKIEKCWGDIVLVQNANTGERFVGTFTKKITVDSTKQQWESVT